jgi:hypothetical protein
MVTDKSKKAEGIISRFAEFLECQKHKRQSEIFAKSRDFFLEYRDVDLSAVLHPSEADAYPKPPSPAASAASQNLYRPNEAGAYYHAIVTVVIDAILSSAGEETWTPYQHLLRWLDDMYFVWNPQYYARAVDFIVEWKYRCYAPIPPQRQAFRLDRDAMIGRKPRRLPILSPIVNWLWAKYHLWYKCKRCPPHVRASRDLLDEGDCFWWKRWKEGDLSIRLWMGFRESARLARITAAQSAEIRQRL